MLASNFTQPPQFVYESAAKQLLLFATVMNQTVQSYKKKNQKLYFQKL